MIQTEIRKINEVSFMYTYSDLKMFIKQDGTDNLYEEAYDPLDSGRTYTETDIPIPEDEPTDEDYAEAGKILMGVNTDVEEES